MREDMLWSLFLETGHPVFYNLYRHVKTQQEQIEEERASKSA